MDLSPEREDEVSGRGDTSAALRRRGHPYRPLITKKSCPAARSLFWPKLAKKVQKFQKLQKNFFFSRARATSIKRIDFNALNALKSMRYNALISMRYNALKSMRFIDVARARKKKIFLQFLKFLNFFGQFWPKK